MGFVSNLQRVAADVLDNVAAKAEQTAGSAAAKGCGDHEKLNDTVGHAWAARDMAQSLRERADESDYRESITEDGAYGNEGADDDGQATEGSSATTGAEASPTPEPPPVFERVKRVLADQLSIEKDYIDLNDSLRYLGIDIRNLTQVVTALEKEFQMEIQKSKAKDFSSVRSVVAFILEHRK